MAIIRNITIPLLMPTITFVLVTGLIGGLQVFLQRCMYCWDLLSALLHATRTVVVHLYERAFTYYRWDMLLLAFILL